VVTTCGLAVPRRVGGAITNLFKEHHREIFQHATG
jgi:hypothetical protein